MDFRKAVFFATKDLDVGDHWRFQHQRTTIDLLEINYNDFKEKMLELCNEGYFSAIQDDSVTHYIVLEKPQLL